MAVKLDTRWIFGPPRSIRVLLATAGHYDQGVAPIGFLEVFGIGCR